MRKWRSYSDLRIAPPDDPNTWREVSGFWPTGYGCYATCDRYGGQTAITATGETSAAASSKYAFAAATPTGTIGYVVGTKIWEVASGGGPLTDRTNSRAIGDAPQMAQFGNATICAMGVANPTIVATGGNFTDLAGAPNAELALVCSNAVVLLNTDDSEDGWHASDVGDHTNWATGESASGRLLSTPGPILAACVYRDCIYALKQGSIYRGRYVGGAVKWAWEVVSWHIGMASAGLFSTTGKYAATTCKSGIAFVGHYNTSYGAEIFFYDGANTPQILNPETEITQSGAVKPCLTYDVLMDMLVVNGASLDTQAFYSFRDDAWGNAAIVLTGQSAYVQGNSVEVNRHYGSYAHPTRRPRWTPGTDTLQLYLAESSGQRAGTAYIETSKFGRTDRMTLFSRATPLLRSRTNVSGGSPSATLVYKLFYDRPSISAHTTSASVSEASATQPRFDFLASARFATFRATYTDMQVTIDDIGVVTKDAGTD